MNRAAKRREARERAKGTGRVTTSPARSILREADFEHGGELPPAPGPIGTKLGPYKWGGKTWVLIEVDQPNVTCQIVFAPVDAEKFAEDLLGVVGRIKLKQEGDEELAEPSATPSGLVIAKDLPHGD